MVLYGGEVDEGAAVGIVTGATPPLETVNVDVAVSLLSSVAETTYVPTDKSLGTFPCATRFPSESVPLEYASNRALLPETKQILTGLLGANPFPVTLTIVFIGP
jgi:hypothetical protein